MEADLATAEKRGMPTGLHVIHPLSGAELEVWVANYVLMGYGEGAVMAVPAHDERDFEFAGKYGLPIRCVIRSTTGAYTDTTAPWQPAYAEHGMTVNSGAFDKLDFQQAVDAIATRWRQRGSAKSACSSGCATGGFPASATGARRSRSSIARAAVTCRCPTTSCRWCCPRTACRTAAAIRSTSARFRQLQLPEVRAAGAA